MKNSMVHYLEKRKTKIIATLGPATSSPARIEELLMAGADVFRLNLSHSNHAEHERAISAIREQSRALGMPAAILLDLQGPRIRVGRLSDGPVTLVTGERIKIVAEGALQNGTGVITTTYKDLYKDVRPGDRVLMDDGLLEVRVIGVDAAAIDCEVVFGGTLKEHKGMNLPGVCVSAPGLTEKDLADLAFGIEKGVDYVALSFVRKASDVAELKSLIRAKGADTPVIAKIEKAEAVEDIDQILEEAYGIMIARGDLGVELSAERVPVIQKKLIAKANEAGRLVITATQMLESMITNQRPTRAEASDVANAVFDGTDALMLSGETAVGAHPGVAVMTMSRIALEAEEASLSQRHILRRGEASFHSFAQAVAFAAHAASLEVKPKAIVVFTESGDTARILSKLKPLTPVIAFTPLESTWCRLALHWGVQPYILEYGGHTDEMICRGEAAMLDHGLAEMGDTVVIVSGTKVHMKGATNMMKIDWIGSEECKLYLKSDAP